MAVPTLTANSPSAGSIAWGGFNIQYAGATFSVAAGSTSQRYVWWVYNNGAPVLSAGAAVPATLTADDLVLFVNKNGVPVNVQSSTVVEGSLIVDGSIVGAALVAGTIQGDKIAAATITGDLIAANTITANLIGVGDFANYYANGSFDGGSGVGWAPQGGTGSWSAGWAPIANSNFRSGWALKTLSVTAGYLSLYDRDTITGVAEGDQFYLSCKTYNAAPAAYAPSARIAFYNASGAVIAGGNIGTSTATTAGAYVTRTVNATAPAGTASARVWVEHYGGATGTTEAGEGRIGDLVCRRINSGNLIVDGTITASKIAAGAITAEKISVGDLTNYAFGSDFEGTHPWTWTGTAFSIASGTAQSGTKSLQINGADTSAGAATLATPISCVEGDKFYLEFWARRDATWNGTGSNSKIRLGRKSDSAFVGQVDFAAVSLPAANTWYKRTGVITVPAATTDLNVTIAEDATAGNLWIDNIVLRRMVAGELIVDGSIKAASIHTDGLDAASIKTGVMSADRIDANTLTIGKVKDLTTTLDSKAGTAYLQSFGTDLVANGTGALKTNYNFSQHFNVDLADAPTGSVASFVAKTTNSTSTWADELIPYDPSKKYRLSFKIRQTVAGSTHRAYGMLIPYDSSGSQIAPGTFMFQPNTTTTLAAPLANGDTVIKLTDATNWYGQTGKPAGTSSHYRSMILWDWVDPNGKKWPPFTYSRNYWAADTWLDGGVDLATNTITLRVPWSGGSFPTGHPVSNGSSGGTYTYMPNFSNTVVPETWTLASDVFDKGIMPDTDAATGRAYAADWGRGLPPGTASIKIGWLLNYAPSPANPIVGRHAIAAVSFSDASAAQATADTVTTLTNGWKMTGKTTINGGAIETDTIAAAQIKAGAVTASKMVVGDTANMAELNETVAVGHIFENVQHTITNGWSTRSSSSISQYFMFRGQKGPLTFKTGDRLRISYEAYTTTGNVTPGITLWAYGNANVSNSGAVGVNGTSSFTITATPQTFHAEMPVTIDTAGKTTFLVGLTGLTSKDVFLRNVRVYRMGAGELIVDGGIVADKIATNAVTADKIAANAVTANKLSVVMGGGNLWSNSSFEHPTDYMTGWAKYDNAAAATMSKVTGRLAGSAARATWTTPGTSLIGLFRQHPTGFKVGEKYTLSFYAKASGSAVGKQMGYAGNATFVGAVWNSNPALTASWQRYSLTFGRPADTNDSVYWGVSGLTAAAGAGTIDFDDVQLEDGDVTTAYTPQVDEILPGTIVTAMLAADSVKATQIAADAVEAVKIKADAVESAKIKAGAVVADKIAAGAITAEKLTVGAVGDNIILNGNFRDLTGAAGTTPLGWGPESAGAGTVTSDVRGTDTYLQVATPAAGTPGGNTVYQTGATGVISVTPGDQFHVEVGAVSTAAGQTFKLAMHTYDRTGLHKGLISSASLTTLASASNLPSANRQSAVLTVPTGLGIASVRFALICETATTTYLFDKYTVGKVSVSARIADGAITADKILAKAVKADKIDTNAVRATHIEAGAITADKIHVGAKGFGVNDNSNFEQEATDAAGNLLGKPSGWGLYRIGGAETLSLEKVNPLSGSQSARVDVPANNSALFGTELTALIPVNPGEKWFASARVKAVGGDNVAWEPIHLTFHTAKPGHDPYSTYNAPNQADAYGTMGAIANGEDKTISGTFTVGANDGHTRAAVSIRLPPRTAAGYYLIEDFVAHPAIENAMVTDISAGKLTTGFIQAGTKVIAGAAETGARVEMNANGIYAYNSSNAGTFVLDGASGNVSILGSLVAGSSIAGSTITGSSINGSTITAGNPQGINMTLSNTVDNQGSLGFNNAGSSWGPGSMTAQYWEVPGDAFAAVRVSSPYNAGRGPNAWTESAYIDVRNNGSGLSQFYVRAMEANFSGQTFIYGSDDGSTIDFRAWGGQGFQFSDYNQSSRLRFIPQIGYFTLRAADSSGTTQELRLQGSQVALSAGGNEIYYQIGANTGYPCFHSFARNVGFSFGTDRMRVTTWRDDAWMPIAASQFAVNSDPRLKDNVEPVTGALDAMRALEVYDYDMVGVLPRKTSSTPHATMTAAPEGAAGLGPVRGVAQRTAAKNRARGVMADKVREVLPDVVNEDEHGNLSLSLYDLLATTMAAVKELDAEVAELRGRGN